MSGKAWIVYLCKSVHHALACKGGILHPQDDFQTWIGPVDSETGCVYLRGRGRQKTAEQHKRWKVSPECFEWILEKSKES